MPRMSNIVLKNDLPTQTTHTFEPMSLKNSLGVYLDDVGDTLQNRMQVTISTRAAARTNQGHKTVMKLTQPHAPVDSEGVCCVPPGTIPAQSHFTVEIVRNNVASDDDILNLIQMLQEAVADSQFTECAFGKSLLG